MYRSPIDVIHGQWKMELENEIYRAVQKVGVYVDKAELEKALAYDREQYKKGYADGVSEFAERFIYKAFCEGCSGCCNCYEEGKQSECDDWKAYMEIAEQMKGV